ncbi:MAG: ATPase central domain protein [Verrucomicrobiales bacterium]|nr:ATPase central domain protein [Verrucomicrobiales bacterium]
MTASNALTIRTYLFDIAKIVEGALNADYEKVSAYSKQLCERLEADGEKEGAKRIKQLLGNGKMTKLGFARAGSHGSHNVPVDAESRMTMADEERLAPGDVDIFLPEDTERSVKQFLSFFRAADRLVAHGVGVAPSMLMFGPPGCGKTQLARFIAAELGLPLITARTDGLISSYLGSTAKNLRALFEHAASRPCVLFLDEFDALAKMRDDAREMGELKRVVISLLQNIDALGKDHVLLAATNHDHLLDKAIWRRFSYRIRLSEPDRGARRRMLEKFFGGFASEDIIALVSAVTEGLSGAQLRQTCEECVRSAILADEKELRSPETIQAFLVANPKAAISATPSREAQIRLIRDLVPKEFTQEQLADIFNVSQSQVSKILKGGS